MAGEFWLDDQQWAVIAALLPTNKPGAHRTDDRRVISGIIDVLRSGCRWQDCLTCYGPSNNHLQSLPSLVCERNMAAAV
ncbi:transposase [Rhizobium leguminosarum]